MMDACLLVLPLWGQAALWHHQDLVCVVQTSSSCWWQLDEITKIVNGICSDNISMMTITNSVVICSDEKSFLNIIQKIFWWSIWLWERALIYKHFWEWNGLQSTSEIYLKSKSCLYLENSNLKMPLIYLPSILLFLI